MSTVSDAELQRLRDERVEQARRAACYPDLLAAVRLALPAIRWGMTHQPGNLGQWLDCEAMLLAAIAKASPQAQ